MQGGGLGSSPVARTSDADRTRAPRYFWTTSVVMNETTRSDMSQVQLAISPAEMSTSNQVPSSLRQRTWIDIPSFLFKPSKPTRTSRYKALTILTVRETWGIVQRLGAPGEFRSTINPTDTECKKAIDHIRKMKGDITSKYAVYAKKYAVRCMNKHWEDNAQVAVKMTSWSDAV
jgi:hypothetical protein